MEQTDRVNLQKSSSDDYHRMSIFILFLGSITLQLKNRFNQQLKEIIPRKGLISANFCRHSNASILCAAKIYKNDLV